MSDLFHKEGPRTFIEQVFDIMERAHWHQFQLLTKRSSLMRNFLKRRYATRPARQHIWLGVSVEDRARLSRVRHLKQSLAAVRFLSVKQLIAPVGQLDLTCIDWVTGGGESGPRSRHMPVEWVGEFCDQSCKDDVSTTLNPATATLRSEEAYERSYSRELRR